MMYSKLGTLGKDKDDVTCSILAAKSMLSVEEIVAYEQFEIASEALITKEIDAMLVPCAYPMIGSFIMHRMLCVAGTYLYQIPPLVFASAQSDVARHYDVLYNHIATDHLLSETGVDWSRHQHVSSNTYACTELLKSSGRSCAITNEVCASRYGLHINKVLREAIMMPFLIFVNIEMGGEIGGKN